VSSRGGLFGVHTFDVAEEQNGTVNLRQLVQAVMHQLTGLLPLKARFGGVLLQTGRVQLVFVVAEVRQQSFDNQVAATDIDFPKAETL
jgi:hypothetical protein